MADVNVVVLAGRLTRDPEVRAVGETSVCSMGLAIGRKFKGKDGTLKEETTFVDIEAWGRTGETSGQYLKKGNPVIIEGELRLDQWEDKTSGQKRSKLKVVANRVHFGAKPAGAAKQEAEAPEEKDIPF